MVNILDTTSLILFWTYRCLKSASGFSFETRPRECLPPSYQAKEGETCYFVLGYIHPNVDPTAHLSEHVTTAMHEAMPEKSDTSQQWELQQLNDVIIKNNTPLPERLI
jgi:hypothetical protein